MQKKTALILTVMLGVAASVLPIEAWGHAFPSGEKPKVGSTVSKPPAKVVITFDSPIEQLFAKLAVTDDAGHDVTAGAPTRSDDERQLSVALKPLAPGDYHVKWSVAAQDGHRTEGGYLFTVAGGS
jgi:methionine-rich copper-binding protein CopC